MATPEYAARTLPMAGLSARRRTRGLTPGWRRLVLTAHIIVSVGALGIYAAILLLAAVAATTADPATSSAAYRSLGVLRGAIPPAAGSVLVTGLILALGTPWGLFRHYWVVAKLALTAFILPVSILVVFPAVRQAGAAAVDPAADPGRAPLLLIAASGAIILALAAATALGVYKPWGAIPRRAAARSGPTD